MASDVGASRTAHEPCSVHSLVKVLLHVSFLRMVSMQLSNTVEMCSCAKYSGDITAWVIQVLLQAKGASPEDETNA